MTRHADSVADRARPIGALRALVLALASWATASAHAADADCDAVRVARSLSPLKLHFELGDAPRANEVLQWVCAQQPGLSVRPSTWLVALVHRTRSSRQAGFVLAEIEPEQGRLVRHGRLRINLDDSVNLMGALTIEPSRHLLQSGRPAVGVRMAMAAEVRWAEGGHSDYLSLFAPEGRTGFRPVLEWFPMSSWGLGGDLPACFRPQATGCIRYDVQRTMGLGEHLHAGWRELVLSEQVRSDPPGHERDEAVNELRLERTVLRMDRKGRYQ